MSDIKARERRAQQSEKSRTSRKLEDLTPEAFPFDSLSTAIQSPSHATLTPDNVKILQRTHGNQFVNALINRSRIAPPLSISSAPRRHLQRKISGGDDLPTLQETNLEQIIARLPRAEIIKAEKASLNKQSVKTTAFNAAKTKATAGGKPLPTDEDLTKAVQIYLSNLNGSDSLHAALVSAFAVATTGGQKRVLNALFTEANKDSKKVIRSWYKYLSEFSLLVRSDITGKKLTKRKRRRWARALKKMKIFGKIVNATRKGKDPKVAIDKTEWKDKGSIKDKIEPVNHADNITTDLDNGKFAEKVSQADTFFKQLMEPHRLSPMPRPTIKVHKTHAMSFANPNGFRAYQSGNEVHVAQDHRKAIVIHEVGHYIESKLPLHLWQDIMMLIQHRHTAKGGGEKAVGGTEGRFAGDYAVTGGYTSRAYESGDTEMMSMTLEYLSQPDKVKTMVNKDPQQVAVIIRALRPQEYANTKALREFDEFLPG